MLNAHPLVKLGSVKLIIGVMRKGILKVLLLDVQAVAGNGEEPRVKCAGGADMVESARWAEMSDYCSGAGEA